MRGPSVSLCLVLVVAAAAVYADAAPNLSVKVTGGEIMGQMAAGGKAAQWLGVPFAAPPVGDLRWRSPQAVSSWSGVRNATSFAANCAQPASAIYGTTSEDCLYLNVYVPAAPKTSGPLPVMLWFYGGSWVSGGAALPLYDGLPDAVDDADIIIVTANYRLGAFGFLGSDMLRNRTKDGSTGNYGLLDQRASMMWVQDNIAGFGGNPTMITLFGESAGAGSISTHLVMEGSKGLFQRAMMESGPMAPWVGMSLDIAEMRYANALTLTGCSTVDCLLSQSTSQIENVCAHATPGPANTDATVWGPVIDGVELMGMPAELAQNGKIASPVPTLFGSNHDEGSMFTPCQHSGANACTETLVKELLDIKYNSTFAAEILAMYPLSNFESPYFQVSRMLGDDGFTCPVRRTARWLLKAGAPVSYVYFFTHRAWWIDAAKPWLGVAHTTELPFVFQFAPFLHTSAEVQLASSVSSYWTSFGATGSPNSAAVPSWPAYSPTADVVQNLNLTISQIAHLKESQCDMWDRIRLAMHH